eukprot:Transcript_3414.p1 GENE.Transcript_3414~~Transcript_3414.p1  ORF type:complete len:305 (-),score=134.29 Transcript_3414:86-1000(-)
MPAPVYRGCSLGVHLAGALDELIAKEEIPEQMREQVMRLFDTAMCDQLKDNSVAGSTAKKAEKLQGRIEEGQLETYRFVNNSWTFDLAQAKFKGLAFDLKTGAKDVPFKQHVHIEAVDAKFAELEQEPEELAPLQAAASAADDEVDAPATIANDEDWEDEEGAGQFDGADDPVVPPAEQAAAHRAAAAPRPPLPQLDGDGFDDDEELDGGTFDDPLDDRPGGGSSSAVGELVGEELNSDDDSEEDVRRPGGAGRGAGAHTNSVHAQFRKVKRQRNKWHCELTAGIAKLDGLDYAFTKCDATFLF